MTPKKIKDFREVFLCLWDQLGMRREEDSELSQKIAGHYRIITDRGVLERNLPSEGKPSINFENMYVWLRPLKKAPRPIPIVTLKCDFRESPPALSVRFALFFPNNNDLSAIGFRLETPHGQEGVHSFCHAQMMRSFQSGQPDLPGCPKWIPESDPAFPLDATCPFSLLISLMVSLYGGVEVGKALSSVKEAVAPLEEIKNSMHLFRQRT